jgi:hypothetical protein
MYPYSGRLAANHPIYAHSFGPLTCSVGVYLRRVACQGFSHGGLDAVGSSFRRPDLDALRS